MCRGNPNNKHGHYYVQHEAAADDDPLVQTNFIYQDADFRGGRNPVNFVLGAVFATFVAPKSTIGTYNFAASEKCHVCCLYPLWCKCC